MSTEENPERKLKKITTIDNLNFSFVKGKVEEFLGDFVIAAKTDNVNRKFVFVVYSSLEINGKIANVDMAKVEEIKRWVSCVHFDFMESKKLDYLL